MADMGRLFDQANAALHQAGLGAALPVVFTEDAVWHRSGDAGEQVQGHVAFHQMAAMKMPAIFRRPEDPPDPLNVTIVQVRMNEAGDRVAMVYAAAQAGDPRWEGQGLILGRLSDNRIVEAWHHHPHDERVMNEFLAASGGTDPAS